MLNATVAELKEDSGAKKQLQQATELLPWIAIAPIVGCGVIGISS
jgi:hypothetical protein